MSDESKVQITDVSVSWRWSIQDFDFCVLDECFDVRRTLLPNLYVTIWSPF